jgi:uncharacterized membrane protein
VSQRKSSKPASPATPEARLVASQQWQGPVPPPAALEHFERIVPGSAARLIEMAEAEQKHRHSIEAGTMFTQQESVRLTARDNLVGMVLGFVALLCGIGAAVWSVIAGASWAVSLGFMGLPVMIVAAELVRRRH